MQLHLGSSSILLLVFSALAGQVACKPVAVQRGKSARDQNKLLDRFSGNPLECCIVTLMSVMLNDGSPGVQVVQNCVLVVTDSCPSSTEPAATPNFTTSSTTPVVSSTNPVIVGSSTIASVSWSTVSKTVTPSTSDASSTTMSFSQPPSPLSASTSSTANASSQTSTTSSAIASPKQSTALPKLIGIFAGVSIVCLIIGGYVGYMKQKRLKENIENPISWPVTR